MTYKYLVLMGSSANEIHENSSGSFAMALLSMGMVCRLSTSRLCVFTTKNTPTLALPGRGLLIGHVFPRNQNSDGLTPLIVGSDMPLERHLLENFWGEYVLIDMEGAIDGPTSILRDPSGGVRCVYSVDVDRRFFTSDVSIAIELGLYHRQIDWEYITHALTFPHLRTTRTGLAGIRELLPGCTLDTRRKEMIARVAWSPWDFVTTRQQQRDPVEAAINVKNAVTKVVRTWAEIDQVLLLELSGGLDSSILAACLRDTRARTVCCTITTPLSGTDERAYARHMSDLLDVDLTTLRIDAESACFDFPVPSDSVVPGMGISHHVVDALLSDAADTHATNSFMSGAGGDTVFCYLGNASPAVDAFRDQGLSTGFQAIHNLSTLHGCTLSKAARLTLRKAIRGPRHISPANATFLNPSLTPESPMPHPWLDAPHGAPAGDQEWIGALVGTQTYTDRMTRNRRRPMRFPLLSQPVIEACLRVPTWMWISGGRNRSIARDAFTDVLPAPVLNRRSKGTYVSFAGSLYAGNRRHMLRFLEQGNLSARNLLDIASLRKLLTSDVPAKDASFLRIFDLCMIENWIRHQGVANP